MAFSVSTRQSRAVRFWLVAVAALILVTLIVGGATRLTESGLSIVEWKPVTGIMPPLDEARWQAEFEKYQAIPQYRELNRGMSLHEFKTIYWWEWTHRLLARSIGVVFFLPFVWFLWRRMVPPDLRGRLWLIFGLGVLQGAVGWWMVASGLSDRVTVSQYRLALHLTLACLIYAAVLWTLARLTPREGFAAPPRIRMATRGLVVLVLMQIFAGALVAGLRAGLVYNTWPLIDGHLVPEASRLFFDEPWWRNFFENTLMVQFVHRVLGYGLWLLAVLHAVDAVRTAKTWSAGALLLACAVTVQAALGIVTLIHQAPLALALTHQAMALAVLTIAVLHAERVLAKHRGEAMSAPVVQPVA